MVAPRYAAASPGALPSLCCAYLDGAEGVQVRTVRQRTLDGAVFAATLDFTAFWSDHRGWYRNVGA